MVLNRAERLSPGRSCRTVAVGTLLSLAALLAGSAAAQQGMPEEPGEYSPFSARGFGTLGLARSTNGDASYLRDISQPRGLDDAWRWRSDTILGLQATYRFDDVAEAVVQGISSYRYDGSFSPEMTRAFLKYDLSPRLSFRLGRVGMEFLMQSDSRSVGYSYLPVRPPVDYFGSLPVTYGDGADATFRWPLGEGVVRGDVFAGVADEKLPYLDVDGARILKGSLGYDVGPWQFRYIYGQLKYGNSMGIVEPLRAALAASGAASAADALDLEGTTSRYHSLGAAYDDGLWQAQAALGYVRNETVMFENWRTGYLLIGRRFGSVSPFAGYSWARSSRKSLATGLPPSPSSSALNEGVAELLALSHFHRNTVLLGARWDFARNMDLTAQVDFVRSHKSSQWLVEEMKPQWNGRTRLFSLSLDFVF